MGISNVRYQALLSSGKAIMVRPESVCRPVMIEPPDRYDLAAGENGIRVKKLGCVELSDKILALIIKNDQIVGTAILDEDQLEFLESDYYKHFDDYQTQKDLWKCN